MNLLHQTLHRLKCRNTHHKLALDALRHLAAGGLGEAAAAKWADVFLWHIEPYLTGSKAPDESFRDFSNHVLHPAQNNWGGAPRLARKWATTFDERLRSGDWKEAVYAAGVMGHYLTDPFMPLHTGQAAAEAAMHRSCEWSVYRSYDELTSAGEAPATPLPLPTGDDWLEQLVIHAATTAHQHYDLIVERYDLTAAAKHPPDGLSAELRRIIAALLCQAAATLGAVMGRCLLESKSQPPRYPVGMAGLLAVPATPLFHATRAVAHRKERRVVAATWREFATTGRVEKALPDDIRSVKETCERETAGPDNVPALRVSAVSPPQQNLRGPTAHVAQPAARTVLLPGDPVVNAPSIGEKTAKRLAAIGILTVADLLAADPATTAARLDAAFVHAAEVTSWQTQARLACAIAGLHAHDARLLVACGIASAADIAALDPVELWELVVPVGESPDGRRLLRGSKAPDLGEVTGWINNARAA